VPQVRGYNQGRTISIARKRYLASIFQVCLCGSAPDRDERKEAQNKRDGLFSAHTMGFHSRRKKRELKGAKKKSCPTTIKLTKRSIALLDTH
jgi:hypothetical protein